jgi:hypothetical protein
MSMTHYKGIKIPIVFIPNSIILQAVNSAPSSGIDVSSYSTMASIIYADALFFYDRVNRHYNNSKNIDISDLFYSISAIDLNIQTIDNLKAGMSEGELKHVESNVDKIIEDMFGAAFEEYSMLELLLILSDNLEVKWMNNSLVLLGDNLDSSKATIDELIYSSKMNQKIPLSRVNRVIDNFKLLWAALQEHISYEDAMSSRLLEYYLSICSRVDDGYQLNSNNK